MKTSQKLLSVLLAALLLATTMAVCALPASALDATGSCGENVTWNFNSATGALTISGTGKMADYNSSNNRSPFYQNSEIKTVTIEDGVTSVGTAAFRECSSLTSATISDSVIEINDDAFFTCNSLRSVTIGNHVKDIRIAAFEGTALTRVLIPNSVSRIYDSAFRSCSSLKTVLLGNNVSFIGRFAFYGADALTDVYYPGSETRWNNVLSSHIYENNAPFLNAAKHFDSPFVAVRVTGLMAVESVTGGGTFAVGETATVTATPAGQAHFVGWYDGDTLKSTDAVYAFTVTGEVTLIAQCEWNEPIVSADYCHWCGQVHEGFFQKIIGFFHNILARIFGNKY